MDGIILLYIIDCVVVVFVYCNVFGVCELKVVRDLWSGVLSLGFKIQIQCLRFLLGV